MKFSNTVLWKFEDLSSIIYYKSQLDLRTIFRMELHGVGLFCQIWASAQTNKSPTDFCVRRGPIESDRLVGLFRHYRTFFNKKKSVSDSWESVRHPSNVLSDSPSDSLESDRRPVGLRNGSLGRPSDSLRVRSDVRRTFICLYTCLDLASEKDLWQYICDDKVSTCVL